MRKVFIFIICCVFSSAIFCACAQQIPSKTASLNKIESQSESALRDVNVAFFDTKSYEKEAFEKANARYGCNITFFKEKLTKDTALNARGFDFVCVFVNDQVDADVINQIQKLGVKGILLRCAGYDNVDLKVAESAGIPVLNVPSYSPNAIAEHATALLLSLTRHIPQAYNRTTQMNFDLDGLQGRNLKDLTAGIIGTGRIGKITAQIFSGFGMNILLSDPHPDETWAKEKGFIYVNQENLIKESDIISLHCSLNDSTYHLINDETLALMKEDAVLINTGRGALVDSEALVRALKAGTIGGAALDVYENEQEYFFRDCSNQTVRDETLKKLLEFPNVILTGHQAFLTDTALENIAETTFTNLDAVWNEKEIENYLTQ